MRHLMPVVVLLTIGLLAPVAWAESAGPSAPRPGVHRHAAAPRSKAPARAARTRTTRQTARKAPVTRAATRAQTPVRRAPAKRVVVTEVTLV